MGSGGRFVSLIPHTPPPAPSVRAAWAGISSCLSCLHACPRLLPAYGNAACPSSPRHPKISWGQTGCNPGIPQLCCCESGALLPGPPTLGGCSPAPGVQRAGSQELGMLSRGDADAVGHSWGSSTQAARPAAMTPPNAGGSAGAPKSYPATLKRCSVSGRFCQSRAGPPRPSLLP